MPCSIFKFLGIGVEELKTIVELSEDCKLVSLDLSLFTLNEFSIILQTFCSIIFGFSYLKITIGNNMLVKFSQKTEKVWTGFCVLYKIRGWLLLGFGKSPDFC